MGDLQILYLNRTENKEEGSARLQINLMFSDGSMINFNVASDENHELHTSDAMKFMQEIEERIATLPVSGEEVCPVCLGDTTCMYCGGKGCPNCQRDL